MEEETQFFELEQFKQNNSSKENLKFSDLNSQSTLSPRSLSPIKEISFLNGFENIIQAPSLPIQNRAFFIENCIEIINDIVKQKGMKEPGAAKFYPIKENFSTSKEYQQICREMEAKRVELPIIIQVLEKMEKAQDFKKEFKGFSLKDFEYYARHYEFFYQYLTMNEENKTENKLIQNEIEYWTLIDNSKKKNSKTSIRMVLDLNSQEILNSNQSQYLQLNSVSQNKDSLFQPLKGLTAQISGVTTSWIQVCMLFSTKCWSKDGNNLFTIDYLHHGAPKTWYVIGEQYAKEYEQLMQKKYPTIYNKFSKTLFQGLHQVNPQFLLNENIPVFKIVQNPGQFVVIYGGSYYCNFSHGFNFSESLNFTPTE